MLHHDYRGNTAQRRSAVLSRYMLLLWLLCTCPGLPLYAQPSADPGPQQFLIHTGQSVLTIRVGRAGILSAFGHDHLISHRAISGTLTLAAPPGQSAARLNIPVQQLVVDDPVELRDAGFPSIPDAQARIGTRDNMLGEEVLHGGSWSQVIVDATYTGEVTGTHQIDLMLTFKGTTIPLQLPATVTWVDAGLQIDSRFSLGHRQLGLRPYSALGGVIRVAETIEFELHLLVVAADNAVTTGVSDD